MSRATDETRRNVAEMVCLHAKDDIEALCRRNPLLNIYAIGDLDDFFWPQSCYFALRDCGQLRQLVLLYMGCSIPVVMALADEPIGQMRDLLRSLLPFLPRRFYAHLTESVTDVLANDYRIQSHGLFHKMGLTDRSRLAAIPTAETVALAADDVEGLRTLYDASYPGHWFVPRMLATGFYFGVRRAGALVSVAGVHVYSPIYKVAALGNITTRPDARGQGLATAVTARLCQELMRAGVTDIGLNVRADNQSAVGCYQKIGFERVADYGEYTLELK